MFEARGESFQHGKRIAVANGGEQAHYTATYDCMDFRAALEHSSCGGLAGKQFGDRRSPHLYARGPRRPAGVGQDDLYRVLSDLWRRCKDCHEPVLRKRRLKKSKVSCAPGPRDRAI